MVQDPTGAFGCGREHGLEVVRATASERQVDHVGEVVGQLGEIAVGQVDRPGRHAQVVEELAIRCMTEAGDAPHLVVADQSAGERVRPCRSAR